MPCTTLLAGRLATFDGSTMSARNEDSGPSGFCAKRFAVVEPQDHPRHYRSVLSGVEIDLPDDPMRYTAMPNALDDEGIWGAAGVNDANVTMTATETITSNENVLSADPLLKKLSQIKEGETAGGIGEEDMVTLVLPYIHSAREGVLRLGLLLETYGTYEMNGIAFQDQDEVWWLESVGGHHWIARRVPDDCYVVAPNCFGIDWFDLADAFGAKKEHLCSADLREFIDDNHLDLTFDERFNARLAFGSHSDTDHIYNNPRSWIVQKYFNPHDETIHPADDDLAWCRRPERKITIGDVKYALSGYYQGTPYDPYKHRGDTSLAGSLRPIGINRNNFLSIVQIRPDMPEEIKTIEWVAFGSNAFNAIVPLYVMIHKAPEYIANTTDLVTTENFYWANRIIAALADALYSQCIAHIERYQNTVFREGYRMIKEADSCTNMDPDEVNQKIIDMVKKETYKVLDLVLDTASRGMRNAYSRADG